MRIIEYGVVRFPVSFPLGRIIDVSKLFQKGKTQVPEEVRKMLDVFDGDKLVWIEGNNGRIVVLASKRRGRYQKTSR
ncbi:hypothetical protein ES703_88124 [subsurface metagenome]